MALAESAIIGGTGFVVSPSGDLPGHVALFSESGSRAVVSVEPARQGPFETLAAGLGVPFKRLGDTGGPRMVFDGVFETTVAEARAVYEEALPRLLAEPARRAG